MNIILYRTARSIGAIAIFFVSLSFFVPQSWAAGLSISPTQANVSAGNIISENIIVNAGGTAVNTAGATIHFPTDLLQVMSVSKSSSIFTLWGQDPIFSNVDGTISFMGGLPNPGFSGSNGQIISIVFVAKKAGTASVVMSDASVLANDGLGTDVLTVQGSAAIKISAAVKSPIVPAASPSNVPSASEIASTTITATTTVIVVPEETKKPETTVAPVPSPEASDKIVVETSKSVIYDLSFILTAILLALGLIFAVYTGWHRFFGLKRRLDGEAEDAVSDIHKAISSFKDELEKQLKDLEKIKENREFTKKEEKIFKDLRANMDGIDDFIEKKIKKIRNRK